MIEGAGADANDRAAGHGERIRGVFVSEDLRAAVLVKTDRLHVTVTSEAAPRSSEATDGVILSRSPTITATSRDGSM